MAGMRPAPERVDPNVSGNDVLVTMFSSWASDSPSDARTWADALPEGTTRHAVQSALAGSLAANGEFVQAAHVLARLGSAADAKAVADVAGTWARRDPQAVLNGRSRRRRDRRKARPRRHRSNWANAIRKVGNWRHNFRPRSTRSIVGAFFGGAAAWTGGNDERMQEFDRWFDLIDDPWRRAQVARSSFGSGSGAIPPEHVRALITNKRRSGIDRMTLRDNSD